MTIAPDIPPLDRSPLSPPPSLRWKKPQALGPLRFGPHAGWLEDEMTGRRAALHLPLPCSREERLSHLTRLKRYLLEELPELPEIEDAAWRIVLSQFDLIDLWAVFGKRYVVLSDWPGEQQEEREDKDGARRTIRRHGQLLVRTIVDLSGLRDAYHNAGLLLRLGMKRKRGRPPGNRARAQAEGRWTYEREIPCAKHTDNYTFITRYGQCKLCRDEDKAEWEASPQYETWLEKHAKRHRARHARELRFVADGMLRKAASRHKARLKKEGRTEEAKTLESRLQRNKLGGLEDLLTPRARAEWERLIQRAEALESELSAEGSL
jgi:hypothetical protein